MTSAPNGYLLKIITACELGRKAGASDSYVTHILGRGWGMMYNRKLDKARYG